MPTPPPGSSTGTLVLAGTTVSTVDGDLTVPTGVDSLDRYREWTAREPLLERIKSCFINGHVWLESEMEELFVHVEVKSEILAVLRGIVRTGQLGHMFGDGVRVVGPQLRFASEPDAVFVSFESIQNQAVRYNAVGPQSAANEIVGPPDMILEVVSRSSVKKDREWLFDLYAQLGVREYWLADCRQDRCQFEVYRNVSGRYEAVGAEDGWQVSAVFGHAFQLVRTVDLLGHPRFTLSTRPS